MDYAKRVQELEAEGLTTSDAQAVADVEAERIKRWNAYPDLLAACKAMVGDDMPEAGQPGHIDYGKAVEMARAAIAKGEK